MNRKLIVWVDDDWKDCNDSHNYRILKQVANSINEPIPVFKNLPNRVC